MKIKAYTDIQQGRKLAEILSIESADMYYEPHDDACSSYSINCGKFVNIDYHLLFSWQRGKVVPCWSLAALMELLPETVTVVDKEDEEDYTDYILCIIKEDGQWTIYYEEEAHSALAVEWLMDDTSENLIDAAYNIIVKLHNKGLL